MAIPPRHLSHTNSSVRSSRSYSSISISSQHTDRTYEENSEPTRMVVPDDVRAEAQCTRVNHVPRPLCPATDVATAIVTSSSSAAASAGQKSGESSSKKINIQDFRFLKVLGRGCMGKVQYGEVVRPSG